jgi:hypothetical protein
MRSAVEVAEALGVRWSDGAKPSFHDIDVRDIDVLDIDSPDRKQRDIELREKEFSA